MLANSSPPSAPSQLELSIPLCSSKKPTLGRSGGAVQERLVRRSGLHPNYTNLVLERLHYRLGSQVYTQLKRDGSSICRHLANGALAYINTTLCAVHMPFIFNTHSFETVQNRVLADITFFIQNDLRNHLLNLQHKVTVHYNNSLHSSPVCIFHLSICLILNLMMQLGGRYHM
jgi:hypothetical protein